MDEVIGKFGEREWEIWGKEWKTWRFHGRG